MRCFGRSGRGLSWVCSRDVYERTCLYSVIEKPLRDLRCGGSRSSLLTYRSAMKQLSSDQRLALFLDKAKKINGSSFVQTMAELGGTVTGSVRWHYQTGYDSTIKGPDKEQVDAVVLSVRFFLQDKDAGIRKVGEVLESLDGIDAALLAKYREIRDNLSAYLESWIGLNLYDMQPSRRDVLVTILYGNLCHADPDHAPRYEKWMGNPFPATWVWMEFLAILGTFIKAVVYLANIVEKIRDERAHQPT